MTKNDRLVVENVIQRHCEIRDWYLHAVNARSNHVHVVVTAYDRVPDQVHNQFKAWCTRTLKTTYPGRTRFWTERSSCRWINHEADLEAAVAYVLEAQSKDRIEDS